MEGDIERDFTLCETKIRKLMSFVVLYMVYSQFIPEFAVVS